MFDKLNSVWLWNLNFKLQNCADTYYKSAQLEYYKFAQRVLQICAGITNLLQICAGITNLRKYYKSAHNKSEYIKKEKLQFFF